MIHAILRSFQLHSSCRTVNFSLYLYSHTGFKQRLYTGLSALRLHKPGQLEDSDSERSNSNLRQINHHRFRVKLD